MREEGPRNQLLYWRRDWFRSLKEIAREATQSPAWTGYGTYCTEHCEHEQTACCEQASASKVICHACDRKLGKSVISGPNHQSKPIVARALYAKSRPSATLFTDEL
jgi:hypothetical protein